MLKTKKIDNWQKYFQKYNQNKLALHFSTLARENIFHTLNKLILNKKKHKNLKILDFGVSDSSNKDANPFLKFLNKKKRNTIYGCGLDEVSDVKKNYKNLNYTKIIQNKNLPYKDNYFHISLSHAVFEHVGGDKKKIFYLSELIRVSENIFISIPNRYFPIEHHSNIPFLGYLPKKIIYKLLSFFNYDIFKSEKSLTFNSINQFKKYISYIKVNKNIKLEFGYTGLKLGFFSSHFYIFIRKQK